MPNGKITRWNNDGYVYIGNSLSQLIKIANYSDISYGGQHLQYHMFSQEYDLSSQMPTVGVNKQSYEVRFNLPSINSTFISGKIYASFSASETTNYIIRDSSISCKMYGETFDTESITIQNGTSWNIDNCSMGSYVLLYHNAINTSNSEVSYLNFSDPTGLIHFYVETGYGTVSITWQYVKVYLSFEYLYLA